MCTGTLSQRLESGREILTLVAAALTAQDPSVDFEDVLDVTGALDAEGDAFEGFETEEPRPEIIGSLDRDCILPA